ncbi:hypothetical protein V3C99_011773, partial [Haemonchus contortus]
FGGQVDFIRGASIGDDGEGKPIIALPSMSKKGQSKIVPYINEVGTKLGKNMRQRAYELIKIAHPSQREALEKAAFER